MNSDFLDFLSELSLALQISSLKPDAKGACLLVFKNENISLLFEYDESLVPRTILVSSEICPIPIEIMTDILEEILLENEKISETLSCHPDEDMLYIHRRVHPFILNNELKPVIDSLKKSVIKWRRKVAEQALQPPKRQRIPTPPSQIYLKTFKA